MTHYYQLILAGKLHDFLINFQKKNINLLDLNNINRNNHCRQQ